MGPGSSFRSFWQVPTKLGLSFLPNAAPHTLCRPSRRACASTRPRRGFKVAHNLGSHQLRGSKASEYFSGTFEMSDGDSGVPALDASMDGMEEAGGKLELSPEKSGDARDTSTGWLPSFPVGSASSRAGLAVPELGAGSADRSVVIGDVVQRAAHRPKTTCEPCRIKRKKCPPNCPTLAAEPMAPMPLSAGGEPPPAEASSAPTRRVSLRGKAHRNAYSGPCRHPCRQPCRHPRLLPDKG